MLASSAPGPGYNAPSATWKKLQPRLANPHTRPAFEATNVLTVALIVARSALAREESRGGHYRMDYPFPNDAQFLKYALVKGGAIQFA